MTAITIIQAKDKGALYPLPLPWSPKEMGHGRRCRFSAAGLHFKEDQALSAADLSKPKSKL
jgi:hypothetical protein